MDNEFDRYNVSKKKKKNKKKSDGSSKDKKDKKDKKITIDDLIDPDTNLTDIQRVMKKNRELMLENRELKKKLNNYE
tara:strand:+ start:1647 stop:1877 length:231 start_codon:yes stop_codon:yes gene_type:complete